MNEDSSFRCGGIGGGGAHPHGADAVIVAVAAFGWLR
jgi:hypothetical protein